MKHSILFLLAIICSASSCNKDVSVDPSGIVKDVDATLFLSGTTVTKVPCTLSNGTTTNCYQIISSGVPADHDLGPWCPSTITDDASAGGIWLENGEVYDVDGDFIKNLATFYSDNTWMMYDANGNIYKTETREDCANAANPNVGVAYRNFCVQCLPSYVTGLTQTYLIPVTPVKLNYFYLLRWSWPRK